MWAGQAISVLGDAAVRVAQPFAVLQAGGTALDVGVVLGALTAARVLLLPIGGVLADRYPRRRVMIAADLTRASVQLGVGVILLSGEAQIWELLVGAIAYGAASAAYQPASVGLIPEVVPPAELQRANALVGIARNVALTTGYAGAGVVVALSSAGWLYVIDGLTFMVSAATLVSLHVVLAKRPVEPVVQALMTGWAEVRERAWFWHCLVSFGIANLSTSAFFVIGPLTAETELGGPASWGLLSAAIAIGGLFGGALALRSRPAQPLVWVNAALALPALSLFALAGPAPFALLFLATAIGFGASSFLNAIWFATIQEAIPSHLISRLSSYDWLVSSATLPLGYAAAGALAVAIGPSATLTLAAALLVIPLAIAAFDREVHQVRRKGAEMG
jgi:MFS family permease